MEKLIIMRHAKSDKTDKIDDHARPLNKRGRRAAKKIGKTMVHDEIIPDIILSSTSTRTRETVEIVESCLKKHESKKKYLKELYHASPKSILDVINDYSEFKNVMIVGHNPGLEELVNSLANRAKKFPTAALAVFDVDDKGKSKPIVLGDHPKLAAVVRPKDL